MRGYFNAKLVALSLGLLCAPAAIAVAMDDSHRSSNVQSIDEQQSPASDASRERLASIRNHVLAIQSAVESLQVEYELADEQVQGGLRSKHCVSAMGRKRVAENVHFSTQIPAELDLNTTRMFFTGSTFDVFYLKTRYFETSRGNAATGIPWKLRVDVYLSIAGWWPKGDDDPPASMARCPFTPLCALLADASAVISPESDLVDDVPCVLVTRPQRDRVWLDPTMGYAIRQRELLDARSGEPINRVGCSQFHNYRLGGDLELWLPHRIKIIAFTPQNKLATHEDGSSDAVSITVNDVRVNQADDRDFVFVPPPGTLIQNRDTGNFFQVPGGQELLDDTVVMARKLATIAPNKRATGGQSRGFPPLWLALASIGATLSVAYPLAAAKWGASSRRSR
jgi:hypothetical protein